MHPLYAPPWDFPSNVRDQQEDDIAACIEVDIHRLRLQDTIPSHTQVVVSVCLLGGTDECSYYAGEARSELEYEFGHESKVIEVTPPNAASVFSNDNAGTLHRSKRKLFGLGRRLRGGTNSNTQSQGHTTTTAPDTIPVHNSSRMKGGIRTRSDFASASASTLTSTSNPPLLETLQPCLAFTVILADGSERMCAGKCQYTIASQTPFLAGQAFWLPILNEQGHLHSGIQVSIELLSEDKWRHHQMSQLMHSIPANETMGMVEENEDVLDVAISDSVDADDSSDEEEDEDRGEGEPEMHSPSLHPAGHDLNEEPRRELFSRNITAHRLLKPPPPPGSTPSALLDVLTLSDSDVMNEEVERSRKSWRQRRRRRRLGLPQFRQRSQSASQTAMGGPPMAHLAAQSAPGFSFRSKRGEGLQGIVMMEIVSARDLPRWRNLTHTSFDMDPFVVVSFHRKVFRTRVCRHTLNPEWREKLYFYVHDHEMSYSVRCAVYDWDNMSSNDYVGEISLDVRPFIEASKGEASHTVTLDVPLERENHDEDVMFGTDKPRPTLQLEVQYRPYAVLRRRFWHEMLRLYDTNDRGCIDIDELHSMLLSLGSTLTQETLTGFFKRFGKQPYVDELTLEEGVDVLEEELNKPLTERRSCVASDGEAEEPDEGGEVERVIQLRACPLCHMPRLSHADERDIVTHLALCSSQEGRAVDDIMVSNFVTATQARRKWYTNMLRTMSQGVYRIGANSANILVQDRQTGQLVEEKMQVYVRLGIRLLYQGAKSRMEGARARRFLRNMSIKQGAKYDHPSSVRAIKPFVMFHGIDEDEMSDSIDSFATFNEFFCRRIKMSLRPLDEPNNPQCMVSCADCRLMAFPTVERASQLWIKGRQFSVQKLLGAASDTMPDISYALVIFRLAPQDYHRFHAPVAGTVGPLTWIEGEYYTVNPMAIRSVIDVYGENTRVVIPIMTEAFGQVYLVSIGAMMVGSIVMTAREGQHVERREELGYFKFGGSTLVLLVDAARVRWNDDLLVNSEACIETLVRVGMRIGGAPPL